MSFVLLHIIFSTKERRPVLDADIRPELFAYLATVVRNAGSECLRVGGVEDHVHLAVRLNRTSVIAGIVEEIKTSSSKWIKTKGSSYSGFAWQRGYGVFSVGPADLPALVSYIDGQTEHHRKGSFQDELRALLKKYGMDTDEAHLWD